jgi:hypothetical protein
VGLELTDIAEIFVYPAFVRSRAGTFITSRPFAEHTGGISVLFHYLGQDNVIGVIRMLTHYRELFVVAIHHCGCIRPIFLVAPYFAMSCMLSCHK